MLLQRTWIWENYYQDDEERKNAWLAGAAALRRINVQVLEDVEDFILLKAFKQGPTQMEPVFIEQTVKAYVEEKREREKMELATSPDKKEPEEGKEVDLNELAAEEDKKRKFADMHRPHEKYWNFIVEDGPDKPEH